MDASDIRTDDGARRKRRGLTLLPLAELLKALKTDPPRITTLPPARPEGRFESRAPARP